MRGMVDGVRKGREEGKERVGKLYCGLGMQVAFWGSGGVTGQWRARGCEGKVSGDV